MKTLLTYITDEKNIELDESDESDAFVIAVGCREGRHRSVAVVEEMGRKIQSLTILHRDLGRKSRTIQKQREFEAKRKEKYQTNAEEL